MTRWIWITAIMAALLTGCLPAGSRPVTLLPTTAGDLTLAPEAAQSETPPEQQPCSYTWANESLPEVSEELVQAFTEANLVVDRAYASAFGENCVTADGWVQSFHAMQTDFYLKIAVDDIEDEDRIGEWVEKILPMLDRFPPGEVPGPNPGVVEIHFSSSSGETTLRFPRQKASDLLAQGFRQHELVEALKAPY
jgi:hypothetical protein